MVCRLLDKGVYCVHFPACKLCKTNSKRKPVIVLFLLKVSLGGGGGGGHKSLMTASSISLQSTMCWTRGLLTLMVAETRS